MKARLLIIEGCVLLGIVGGFMLGVAAGNLHLKDYQSEMLEETLSTCRQELENCHIEWVYEGIFLSEGEIVGWQK